MVEKLKKNPFRKGTKPYHFFEISNVDLETGYSRVVPVDQFPKELQLGNGGSWCRSDGGGGLGKYFNIDRRKEKGRIVSVQLVGYKKNTFNRLIHSEIYHALKNENCRVLDISQLIEIDHKDGRYDNYKIDLCEDECQPLHSTVNKAKRQHCKRCKETGKRYDAKKLGYCISQYLGPDEYHGSCVGCYWYDPKQFNHIVSEEYRKYR